MIFDKIKRTNRKYFIAIFLLYLYLLAYGLFLNKIATLKITAVPTYNSETADLNSIRTPADSSQDQLTGFV